LICINEAGPALKHSSLRWKEMRWKEERMQQDRDFIIRHLVRQLEVASASMLEISQRLDITNVGDCKWRLMLSADAAAGALRHIMQQGRPAVLSGQP
jgi:hypothetical protein